MPTETVTTKKFFTSHNILTEGVIIALGSALVYLSTFFYELGYCNHFGIPSIFINPNTTTILVAAAAIGGFIFSSWQLLGFSTPLIRAALLPTESQKPYRLFFWMNGILLIIGILLWRAYNFSWKGAATFAAIVVFINFTYFGIEIIFNREKKTIKEKFEDMHKKGPDMFDMWSLLMDGMGRNWTKVIVIILASCAIAYLIGNGEAARQTVFLASKESPDQILLRSYGEVLIFASIDQSQSKTAPNLFLVRTSSKEKIEFEIRNIGPLGKYNVNDIKTNSTEKEKENEKITNGKETDNKSQTPH